MTFKNVTDRLNDTPSIGQAQLVIDEVLSVLEMKKDHINYHIYTDDPSMLELVDRKNGFDISDVSDKLHLEIMDVSRAITQDSGHIKVKGSIISLSEPYKLIKSYEARCKCGYYIDKESFEVPLRKEPRVSKLICSSYKTPLPIIFEYDNAISVEIQDDEKLNEIERLNCILLDTDPSQIKVGERVIIRGSIHICQKNQKGSLVPVLFFQNMIEYVEKNEVKVDDLDEQEIKQFVERNGENIISALSEMFDKTVIGLNTAKKCLLLSLVSSGNDLDSTKTNRGSRERIHTLLAGNPGLAKSALIKKAVKLVSNGRYESIHHSSGKSLTAIVEKEDEHFYLRLGSIPRSRESICALNEIGTMPFDDQKYLYDVMEEGEFTINKHGIHSSIRSPTTIIASSNFKDHYQNEGKDGRIVHLGQLPMTRPLLDRFDLVTVVHEETEDEALLDYVDKKLEMLSGSIENHDLFLQKYIEYARKLEPVLDPSCTDGIKYYYLSFKKSSPEFSSNRVLETIVRLCKSIAKLKLKETVDEMDVKDAIDLHRELTSSYIEVASTLPHEPDKYTYEKCLNKLKKCFAANKSYYLFKDLLYEVCKEDVIARTYVLGNSALPFDKSKQY